jgi:hypothetical protein
VSSENLLVLMARDKVQGDLLLKRFMAPDDAFVNSDVNNTPWCVSCLPAPSRLSSLPRLSVFNG